MALTSPLAFKVNLDNVPSFSQMEENDFYDDVFGDSYHSSCTEGMELFPPTDSFCELNQLDEMKEVYRKLASNSHKSRRRIVKQASSTNDKRPEESPFLNRSLRRLQAVPKDYDNEKVTRRSRESTEKDRHQHSTTTKKSRSSKKNNDTTVKHGSSRMKSHSSHDPVRRQKSKKKLSSSSHDKPRDDMLRGSSRRKFPKNPPRMIVCENGKNTTGCSSSRSKRHHSSSHVDDGPSQSPPLKSQTRVSRRHSICCDSSTNAVYSNKPIRSTPERITSHRKFLRAASTREDINGSPVKRSNRDRLKSSGTKRVGTRVHTSSSRD